MTPTRRDQIQHVAEQLFREKGYLATSMRDIADHMQMKGGGSLYAHIKGKEDLLWGIANDAADAFFEALTPIIARHDLTPDQKLRIGLIEHMRAIMTHLDAAAVYFDEWRHLTEPRRSQFLQRRDQYERMIQNLIHEGIQGSIFNAVDERLATLHLLSSVNAIRHWYKPDGRLSADEVSEALAGLLLDGLLDRAR